MSFSHGAKAVMGIWDSGAGNSVGTPDAQALRDPFLPSHPYEKNLPFSSYRMDES